MVSLMDLSEINVAQILTNYIRNCEKLYVHNITSSLFGCCPHANCTFLVFWFHFHQKWDMVGVNMRQRLY